jgi:hypothetical protein
MAACATQSIFIFEVPFRYPGCILNHNKAGRQIPKGANPNAPIRLTRELKNEIASERIHPRSPVP